MLAALLRPAAALGGASADQIALHIREAAENSNHQASGAGAGVGPRLGQGSKLRLSVHDLLDDGEQIKGAARQPVNARHGYHVAGREVFEHVEKLAPVGSRAGHLLAVNLGASRAAKLLELAVEGLPHGADAGIADKAFSGYFRSYLTGSITH